MSPLKLALVSALLVGTASVARADNFSFTGNFTADNNVQAFTFTVGAPSTVTLRTLSYAGGVNAAGQTISRGGFDPILALFSGTGSSATYINQNDDGSSGQVPVDPLTGQHYDTYLQAALAAGTYTVTVMQYNNFFAGSTGDPFSLGFQRDGAGNASFTGALGGCSQGDFCDVSHVSPYNNRTNAWAFDIDGVNAAAVIPTGATPEPSSLMLLGTGLMGMAAAARRRLMGNA